MRLKTFLFGAAGCVLLTGCALKIPPFGGDILPDAARQLHPAMKHRAFKHPIMIRPARCDLLILRSLVRIGLQKFLQFPFRLRNCVQTR